MNEAEGRAAIVAEARSWIATKYHDHGEIKGPNGGTDCAKLIACVYTNVGLIADLHIPYYSPQHFLHSDREWYIEVILTFAREIAEAEAKPGDVVTYKMGKCHGHGAIIIDPGFPHIVHAWAPARMVVRGDGLQEGLGDRWRERRFFSHW